MIHTIYVIKLMKKFASGLQVGMTKWDLDKASSGNTNLNEEGVGQMLFDLGSQ
jgi:hypothetical protein